MPYATESTSIKAGTLEEAHKEMSTNMKKYKEDGDYRKALQARISQLEKQQGRDSYGKPKFGS